MQRIEKIRRRRRALSVHPKVTPASGLRQSGIYVLPDGEEVVVGAGRGSSYFLYHPLVWKFRAYTISTPIAYEIDKAGRLITGRGQPTSWRIDDLTDTSRTADRKS